MDKIVRSTVPLTHDSRNGKQSVIALKISDWTREERLNRFKATVEDFKVEDVIDPQPGQPLKRYVQINQKQVVYSNTEIDSLFNLIGKPIQIGESYTDAQQTLLVDALLIVTKQNPIYGSTASQWEIVDTTTEIEPIP